MRRCWALAGMSLLALLMSGRVLGAQTVRGRLVFPESATVPPGILVELVDTERRVVARAISSADGRFQVRAPRAGTYHVRALRIGYRPSLSESVALAQGEDRSLDIRLGNSAVVLNAVNVAEQRVCELNPDSASETAAAWGEVLKALTLSEMTRATRWYHMLVALYSRQLDRNGRFLNQTQYELDGTTVQPFKAVSADSLARYGYVQMEGSNSVYHGPDAQVLLSDAFARTHCLRLVPRRSRSPADSGWIGIAFEPIEHDRPDIAGVLWLDRHSNELREVEYHYVALHPSLQAARPGGRVVFTQLPLGGWIVSRWWIRMPVPRIVQESGVRAGDSRIDVLSIQETGGEVLTVESGDTRVWTGRPSGIAGRAVMESGAAPTGVLLRLENTKRRAYTDSTGRFAFDVLLPGRYTVVVEAAHLSALGQPPLRVSVTVSDSITTPLRIVVPSQKTVIMQRCGEDAVTDSLGLLRVIVVDSATRAPATDAVVRAEWHESLARHGTHVRATNAERIAAQVGPGVFWFCAVPKDRVIYLKVKRGARLLEVEVGVPSDAVLADHRVSIGSP